MPLPSIRGNRWANGLQFEKFIEVVNNKYHVSISAPMKQAHRRRHRRSSVSQKHLRRQLVAVCALNSGQQTVDVGLRDLGVKRLFVGVIVVVAAVVGMCVWYSSPSLGSGLTHWSWRDSHPGPDVVRKNSFDNRAALITSNAWAPTAATTFYMTHPKIGKAGGAEMLEFLYSFPWRCGSGYFFLLCLAHFCSTYVRAMLGCIRCKTVLQ